MMRASVYFLASVLACTFAVPVVAGTFQMKNTQSLWSHDNLLAWTVVPYDSIKREPEERAAMLKRIGFKNFAYDWREEDIAHFDEELKALKRQDIRLSALWFPLEADDPRARAILATLKAHDARPQLWVYYSAAKWDQIGNRIAKLMPAGLQWPLSAEALDRLPTDQREQVNNALISAIEQMEGEQWPKTPHEHKERVRKEAERVKAVAKLAQPYGLSVALYSHNGWLGVPENQIAVIRQLKTLGIDDVGIVYNFSHAWDGHHNDTENFRRLWRSIRPYVVTVNVAGVHREDTTTLLPTQGCCELEMMRVIQESGWKAPVGLIAESGGDAEVTLANARVGLDWLAAEINKPGSGGAMPYFASPAR